MWIDEGPLVFESCTCYHFPPPQLSRPPTNGAQVTMDFCFNVNGQWLLLPFLSVQHYLQTSLGLHVCKGIWIGYTLDKLQLRSLLLNLAVQPRRVQGGRIKTQDYFAIIGQEIWKPS
jgi:hypothetical protein